MMKISWKTVQRWKEGWARKRLMFKDRLDAVNLKREWLLKIESGWLCSNFQLRSMGVLYQSVSQPYRPVSTMLSLLSPLSLSVVGVKHSKPRKFFSQFDILNAWTWLHLPALLSAFYHQVHSSALWELVFFAATYRGIWLHYMVLVRMNLIWLADLHSNNKTTVGIRVLTDRAKCCPIQVPSASAQ